MKLLLPLFFLLLAGCAASAPEAQDPADQAPDFGQPGEVDYHVFMGELALQRERPALAATEFLRASRLSEDPALAERSARYTAAYGTPAEAAEAASRWAVLAPDSLHPVRLLVRARLALGEAEAAAVELQRLRAAGGDNGRAFLSLLPLAGEARDPGVALRAMASAAAAFPEDPSGAYAEAYLALRAGELERARAGAERTLELDPDWIEATLLYARVLAAADEVAAALAWLEAHPAAEERELRLERATILINAGREAEARELLQAVLAEAPADPEALRALGYMEFHAGNATEARAAFMTLLAHGQYRNDALFYLGGMLEQEGDTEKAAQLYARIDGGEHLLTAQVRLALMMVQMGRPELGLEHLERFAERNPAAAVELGIARGELLARLGRAEEAVPVYDQLLERDPENVALLYERGMLLIELGRIEGAASDFARVVELRPEDPTALNALGYTLADGTERLDEALALITRALRLDPESPAILDSMGWVLFRLGRAAEALPYLEAALVRQHDPEIAAHLGEVLWSLGRVEEAREVWADALGEFPGSGILLDTMGRLDP
mgnify:CR=1 FL=1